jgi:hypothetical protein
MGEVEVNALDNSTRGAKQYGPLHKVNGTMIQTIIDHS